MKALNSLYEAQKIAFSPFVFQTVYTMSSLGIMDELYEEREGLTIEEIAKRKNRASSKTTIVTISLI